MQYKKVDDGLWVVVLKKGERIVEALRDFVEKEGINSGYFNAIGAVSAVELGHYDLERGDYTTRKLETPLEIGSLMGNVTTTGEEKVVHGHIVVGTEGMLLYGGHLREATVAATCEIVFREFKERVSRRYDSEIRLNLIAPEE